MLILLVSPLCTADCADAWIIFHILIFCWNENYKVLWVDGQGLNVYKVMCWYRFRETSVFKLHVPLEENWLHCRLGVDSAWGFNEHPVQPTQLTWAFLRQRDATQGLFICYQCDHSGCLDAEFGLFIIQYSYKVIMMPEGMMFIGKVKPKASWVKPWKTISKGEESASSAPNFSLLF